VRNSDEFWKTSCGEEDLRVECFKGFFSVPFFPAFEGNATLSSSNNNSKNDE